MRGFTSGGLGTGACNSELSGGGGEESLNPELMQTQTRPLWNLLFFSYRKSGLQHQETPLISDKRLGDRYQHPTRNTKSTVMLPLTTCHWQQVPLTLAFLLTRERLVRGTSKHAHFPQHLRSSATQLCRLIEVQGRCFKLSKQFKLFACKEMEKQHHSYLAASVQVTVWFASLNGLRLLSRAGLHLLHSVPCRLRCSMTLHSRRRVLG